MQQEIEGMLNAVSVLNQIAPEDIVEEWKKDPIFSVFCPYVTEKILNYQPSPKLNQRLYRCIYCSLTD